MTRCSPSTPASASKFPMPFCSVSASPSGASTRAAVVPAAAVALVLTKTMATSAPETVDASVVAGTLTRISPPRPSRRRPEPLIASTCSCQTSISVTSWPAWARRPP
jgi:hypothetical protein